MSKICSKENSDLVGRSVLHHEGCQTLEQVAWLVCGDLHLQRLSKLHCTSPSATWSEFAHYEQRVGLHSLQSPSQQKWSCEFLLTIFHVFIQAAMISPAFQDTREKKVRSPSNKVVQAQIHLGWVSKIALREFLYRQMLFDLAGIVSQDAFSVTYLSQSPLTCKSHSHLGLGKAFCNQPLLAAVRASPGDIPLPGKTPLYLPASRSEVTAHALNHCMPHCAHLREKV